MIDPMLKALGWDTSNPSQVQMEARLPQTEGIPDYALFKKNAPGGQRPSLGDGRTETTASNGASALQHRPGATPEDPEWANQMLQASYAATFRVIREMLAAPTPPKAAPTPEGGEDHGKSRTP